MLRHVLASAIAVCVALALLAPTAQATNERIVAAQSAIDYITGLQNSDGGFPAFGSASDPGSTLDAVFAFVAFGSDPTTIVTGGNGPDDYLATQAASYSGDPGAAAKLSLGVSLMGLDPTSFGGVDLLATMDGNYNGTTGEYGLDTFDAAFHIFALAAEGEPVPAAAVSHLQSLQNVDGGWPFFSGDSSDQNTTALVLQALLAGGVTSADQSIVDGLGYLATAQNGDGGFGFLPGEPSDPNSTAFAIQALVAAGEDIDTGGPWAPGGNTPIDALLSFQNQSTGAFQFAGSDSAFATYQAVPAAMLAPFPDVEATGPVGGIAEVVDLGGDSPAASGGVVRGVGVAAVIAGVIAGATVLGGAAVVWRRSA